jgi:hypothetical protein
MTTEKIKAKDDTEFEGPTSTGNPRAKRPADRNDGDHDADESVGKSEDKGKDLPISEELNQMFGNIEGLSEDFVHRATTLMEAAVANRVNSLIEDMEITYQDNLTEQAALLESTVSSYLDLVVENYLEQNRVALESGFRREIAEDVIASIQNIVESAGFDLSDEQIDVADALVAENENLTARYNDALNETIELKRTIRKFQMDEAFNEHTQGLTEGTKDKLRRITESMDFSGVDQFVAKLDVLKETFTDTPSGGRQQDLNEASDLATQSARGTGQVDTYIRKLSGIKI